MTRALKRCAVDPDADVGYSSGRGNSSPCLTEASARNGSVYGQRPASSVAAAPPGAWAAATSGDAIANIPDASTARTLRVKPRTWDSSFSIGSLRIHRGGSHAPGYHRETGHESPLGAGLHRRGGWRRVPG